MSCGRYSNREACQVKGSGLPHSYQETLLGRNPSRPSSIREAEDQRTIAERNQAAILLLRQWMKEGPVCDDQTWQNLKQSIEENRLSYRKRFHD